MVNKLRIPNYECSCGRNSFSISICPCTKSNCKAIKKGMISAHKDIITRIRRKVGKRVIEYGNLQVIGFKLLKNDIVYRDENTRSLTFGKILTQLPGAKDGKILDIIIKEIE